MALRFMDSFDHYLAGSPTQAFLRKWSATRNGTPSAFQTGRFGTAWSGNERWSIKTFPDAVPSDTWTIGGAIQFGSSAAGYDTVNEAFFGFWDSGTLQVDVRYNATTKYLYVTRNGTQLGSAFSFSHIHGQWYFIELKVKINNTTGTVELKVDGTSVITLTGQDTQNSANPYANQIRIGSSGDIASPRNIDDLYVCDGTGGAPTNSFLGDVRIEAKLANGNGNTNNMVGSDGNSVDNYLLVDDPQGSVDDDTTYTESGTVGEKDLYTFADLTTASGTVYGVQIVPLIRKTDAGARTAVSVARLAGSETDGPTQTLGTSYAYMPDIRETKPGGGGWTIADVNNAEFGWKVTG